MNTPTRMDIWQTRLENAIAWLSPVWAYRRARQRQMREDEQRRERQRRADDRDRRDGWRPAGPPREALEADARRRQPWLQRRRDRRREFHWGG